MPERDQHSRVKGVVAFDTQLITGAGVEAGNSIDMDGFESIEYFIQTGVVTLQSATSDLFTIEQSPDDGAGAPTGVWVPVPAAEQLGATLATILTADDDLIMRIGSVGKERHQRIKLTSTGANGDFTVGVTAVLGHPRNAPVADQFT